MWSLVVESWPVARKRYLCCACKYLAEYSAEDFDEADRAEFRSLVDNQFIQPGNKYLKVKGKFDGEWSVFRAIPEADQLCRKYGLYEE